MKSEKLRDSAEVSFPVGKGSQLFLNHLLTQLQYLGQLHNLSQKIIHPEDFFLIVQKDHLIFKLMCKSLQFYSFW